MAAKQRDMGVVGSTSNILDFITGKVRLLAGMARCAGGVTCVHFQEWLL